MIRWLLDWTTNNAGLLGLISAVSITLLCLSVFFTPWLLAKLPANYFVANEAPNTGHPLRRLLIKITRNCVGLVLLICGLLMLIVPGPGLVTLVVGLSVCDFQAKQQLLRKLVSQPQVSKALNWMRELRGKPPFESANTDV